jgi:hypothetical protein
MATDFDTAVTESNTYSVQSFNDADTALSGLHPPSQSSPPTSAEQAAMQQYQKDLARWQGQMAKALQQLGQSQSLQDDNDGYHNVAALMKTTADCASSVCSAINGLTAAATTDTNANARLNALAGVLTALGALAPSMIWRKSSASQSQSSQ